MKIEVINIEHATENVEIVDFVTDLYDTDDAYDGVLRMFEGDPDLVKIDGEQAKFIDIDIKGVKYVIYIEEIDGIEGILSHFFDDNWKQHFKPAEKEGWSGYNELDNAIAYRGGSGYNYSIYSAAT